MNMLLLGDRKGVWLRQKYAKGLYLGDLCGNWPNPGVELLKTVMVALKIVENCSWKSAVE